MKNKLSPRSTINSKLLCFKSGGVAKFQKAGKLPIGNLALYDHITEIYLNLVDKGVDPQAALDLVNQKVAEKGWTGYATGDNKKYDNVSDFTDHLIDWHRRMYPKSLKVKNFDEFYEGVNGTREQNDRAKRTRGRENSGRNFYNTEKGWDGYRKDLLKTRPGVKKRINHYRSLLGLPPLAFVPQIDSNIVYAKDGDKLISTGNDTADTVLSFVPFVGTAMDIEDAIKDPSIENIGWAAASLASDIFMVPWLKGIVKAGGKATRAARTAAKAKTKQVEKAYNSARKAANHVPSARPKARRLREELRLALQMEKELFPKPHRSGYLVPKRGIHKPVTFDFKGNQEAFMFPVIYGADASINAIQLYQNNKDK